MANETFEIGYIKEVNQEVSGEGRNGTWYRQNFVIETREQYSRDIDFQVWGRKIDLSTLKVGEKVKVYFNLDSRKGSNGNYYTNATAWKLEKNLDGAQAQPQQSAPQPQNTQAQVNAQIASASQNLNPPSAPPSAPQPEQVPQGDDLPF